MCSPSFWFRAFLLALLVPGTQVIADPPLSQSKDRLDQYGDPLPEGVLARLGTARLRHGHGMSLTFAPDGKTILTSGADRTIRYWDVVSGRQLREQHLPDGPGGFAPVLSPDGQLTVYQDDFETFILWDVARHQLRHRLPLNEIGRHLAVFSPDSKTVVTARQSGVLNAWDVTTGMVRILGGHQRELTSLSFAADGTLATVCRNHELCLWDLARGRQQSRRVLPDHVIGAALSPDGRLLATRYEHHSGEDKGVQFWDATGKPAVGWKPLDVKGVRAVQFAPDGKTIWTITNTEAVQWDPTTGKALRTFPALGAEKIAFSPDGKTVAAFGSVGRDSAGSVLHVWNLTTGTAHAANAADRGQQGVVDCVAFSPDGRTVATNCLSTRSVRVWEAATGRLLRSIPVPELHYRALIFSSDGKHLFQGTHSGILRWDVATGKEVSRHLFAQETKPDRPYLAIMQLTGDGQTLLAGVTAQGQSRREMVLAWDVTSGKLLRSVLLPVDTSPTCFYSHFSPDGRLLALMDGGVYDTTTGAKVLRFSVEGMRLRMPVAFSHDGALLALGTWQTIKGPDGQSTRTAGVQVWEVTTALPIIHLKTGDAAHGAFTPDGRDLIIGGPDALTRWDLATGRATRRQPAHARTQGTYGPSFASSFALAADGHTVATGHADTTALVRNLAPPPSKPAAPLTAEQQEVTWADLAGEDAGRAQVALTRLADVPEQTTRWLREHLHPVQPVPAKELQQWITDLESPQFDRREKARNRLSELDELADAALRAALNKQPSAELRRQLETLLVWSSLARTPAARRHLRTVRLLEMIGTTEARQVLEKLAAGAAEARLTREAKAAAGRLAQRRS